MAFFPFFFRQLFPVLFSLSISIVRADLYSKCFKKERERVVNWYPENSLVAKCLDTDQHTFQVNAFAQSFRLAWLKSDFVRSL